MDAMTRERPVLISFTVPGTPVAKQRPRFGRRGNIYTPERTTAFEGAIRAYYLRAAALLGCRTCREACAVTIRVYCPDRRPRDADNLAKACLDGLNGAAFADDRLVDELHVFRFVDRERPRVEVTIERRTS